MKDKEKRRFSNASLGFENVVYCSQNSVKAERGCTWMRGGKGYHIY